MRLSIWLPRSQLFSYLFDQFLQGDEDGPGKLDRIVRWWWCQRSQRHCGTRWLWARTVIAAQNSLPIPFASKMLPMPRAGPADHHRATDPNLTGEPSASRFRLGRFPRRPRPRHSSINVMIWSSSQLFVDVVIDGCPHRIVSGTLTTIDPATGEVPINASWACCRTTLWGRSVLSLPG